MKPHSVNKYCWKWQTRPYYIIKLITTVKLFYSTGNYGDQNWLIKKWSPIQAINIAENDKLHYLINYDCKMFYSTSNYGNQNWVIKRWSPIWPINIRLGVTDGTKHYSLLRYWINYDCKMFYSTGTHGDQN